MVLTDSSSREYEHCTMPLHAYAVYIVGESMLYKPKGTQSTHHINTERQSEHQAMTTESKHAPCSIPSVPALRTKDTFLFFMQRGTESHIYTNTPKTLILKSFIRLEGDKTTNTKV